MHDDLTVAGGIPRLLTINSAAAVLECSTRTVRRYIQRGVLPAYKEGDRTVLRAGELQHYMWSRDYDEQFVYLVTGAGRVKIGRAANPAARIRDIQASSPVDLKTIRLISSFAAKDLECLLHRRYAKHRAHGEWFEAAPVLADITRFDDIAVASWAPPGRSYDDIL